MPAGSSRGILCSVTGFETGEAQAEALLLALKKPLRIFCPLQEELSTSSGAQGLYFLPPALSAQVPHSLLLLTCPDSESTPRVPGI